MATAVFRAIMRSSRKLRASLTPSPSKSQARRYPSLTPSSSSNQKRKLTVQKTITTSQSDASLVSSLRNLSLTSNQWSPDRPRSTSPKKSGGVRRLSSVSVSSIVDIADLIKEGKCKNIIVMAGAGISTPSGIPDFRTPGTGLYDNLQEYNIPEPTAIFDIEYFWYDHRPFFCLAKTLYPGNFQPNYVHYFINLLNEKGLLLKMYTQNIDGLERLAGLPPDKLVEAHGSFASASCIQCRKSYDGDSIKNIILSGNIPKCFASKCKGVIKPDIVFFGEDLPKQFYSFQEEFPKCDLLIIMGTSLEVEPFAGIISEVSRSTPRLLINREAVGPFASQLRRRHNDVLLKGDVITGVKRLVKLLEWNAIMEDIIAYENISWESKKDSKKNTESVTGNPEPYIGTGGNGTRNYHTLTGNQSSNSTTRGISELPTRTLEKGKLNKDSNCSTKMLSILPGNGITRTLGKQGKLDKDLNSTKVLSILPGNGISEKLPGKEASKSTSGCDQQADGENSNQLGPLRKNSLFRCNSVVRHIPLLPFRYTTRTLPEVSKLGNFKYIDPSMDLSSAGFGLAGRKNNSSEDFDSSSEQSSDSNSSSTEDTEKSSDG